MAKTTNKKENVPAPIWATELSVKYLSGIAHTFLLHGNIRDYVAGVPGQVLQSYLLASFGKDYDLVIKWNRATGLRLPTNTQRKLFAELVDLPGASSSSALTGSGLAARLNATTTATGTDLAAQLEKIRHPLEAFELFSRLLHKKAVSPTRKRRDGEPEALRAAILIDYAESVVPASDAAPSENDRTLLVMLSEWARDITVRENDHLIIAITDDTHNIHEYLRRSSASWEQIRIALPDFQERVRFMRLLLEDPHSQVKLANGLTYEDVARLTTGLRYIDLEDITLRAAYHEQDLTRELVKARKDEIMASEFEDVLAVGENEFGFESLGGLVEVKADLMETVIAPMRSGQHRLVPMGILLLGPAGTGKTRLTRALAKEAGVTFVELQPSRIFSKWVGDTERRLERALAAIKAMTPAIVFIDEIDQAIGRGESGDNGVSNRVFKRLMEVMSDGSQRGKVLWVAATNRPDLLDAALMRPGRLEKKLPILAPDCSERASILDVLTRFSFDDKEPPSQEEYQNLAAQMINYTGAEIEGVVGKAAQLRARRPEMSIAQALQQAYERIIPTTQNIEEMTRLALLHCNDLDLVPSHLRDLARELRHPQARREQDEAEEITAGEYTRRSRRQ